MELDPNEILWVIFGELLLLEFAARVSLIFSDVQGCMGLKLGGWVALGPTQIFWGNFLASYYWSSLHEFFYFFGRATLQADQTRWMGGA